MIIDYIPADTPFSSHTQADGSNIGGVPPAGYSISSIPGKRAAWLMQTSGSSDATGKGYPAVMFYPAASSTPNARAIGRPILPNTGTLIRRFRQRISASAMTAANVKETDTILVIGGFKYNLSLQRHMTTGQIDVGNWTNTGKMLGAMTPNQDHEIAITSRFNTTTKTGSVVSYECDGVVSPITVLPNTLAVAINWPDGAYVQNQMGSLPAGAPWEMVIEDDRYIWL